MQYWLASLLVLSAVLAGPQVATAFTLQEAILRAKPAVVLVTARVDGDVELNCG